MTPSPSRLLAAIVLAWLLLPQGARAADSQDACVGYIAPEPWHVTITQPGTWCMNRNVTTQDDHYGVVVRADDVTIDCKGFTLDDGDLDALNEAVTTTIYANLTVRNCHFKGFMAGVTTNGGDGLVIEDNVFEDMYVESYAESGIFRRNVMRDGHLYIGRDMDVVDNTFSGSGTWSITVYEGPASIRGNRISGGGIEVFSRGRPKIRDNELTGLGTALGIRCDAGSEALLKDNLITGYATPSTGCIEAGGNYTAP